MVRNLAVQYPHFEKSVYIRTLCEKKVSCACTHLTYVQRYGQSHLPRILNCLCLPDRTLLRLSRICEYFFARQPSVVVLISSVFSWHISKVEIVSTAVVMEIGRYMNDASTCSFSKCCTFWYPFYWKRGISSFACWWDCNPVYFSRISAHGRSSDTLGIIKSQQWSSVGFVIISVRTKNESFSIWIRSHF